MESPEFHEQYPIFFADRTSESYKGFNKGRQWNMRNRDVESIRTQVDGLDAVSPILWGERSEKNIVFGQMSGTFNVKGVQPDYFRIETQRLKYGRLLNEIDEREKRKVCLIGEKCRPTALHPCLRSGGRPGCAERLCQPTVHPGSRSIPRRSGRRTGGFFRVLRAEGCLLRRRSAIRPPRRCMSLHAVRRPACPVRTDCQNHASLRLPPPFFRGAWVICGI